MSQVKRLTRTQKILLSKLIDEKNRVGPAQNDEYKLLEARGLVQSNHYRGWELTTAGKAVAQW